MTIYRSQLTPKGNSSYSYTSQQEADVHAAALDANGCTDCTDCTDCTRCTGCTRCRNCYHCTDCTDCTRCTGCTRCTDCTNCTNCTDCTGCTGCMDCTGAIIQAGLPNGWPCYGWMKNGRLIIHCGCRRKTFAEAVKYWSNKPDRLEVLMACHYIASVAHSRGWKV